MKSLIAIAVLPLASCLDIAPFEWTEEVVWTEQCEKLLCAVNGGATMQQELPIDRDTGSAHPLLGRCVPCTTAVETCALASPPGWCQPDGDADGSDSHDVADVDVVIGADGDVGPTAIDVEDVLDLTDGGDSSNDSGADTSVEPDTEVQAPEDVVEALDGDGAESDSVSDDGTPDGWPGCSPTLGTGCGSEELCVADNTALICAPDQSKGQVAGDKCAFAYSCPPGYACTPALFWQGVGLPVPLACQGGVACCAPWCYFSNGPGKPLVDCPAGSFCAPWFQEEPDQLEWKALGVCLIQ